MEIVSRIIGGLMLFVVIFTPFVMMCGVLKVIITTIAIILFIGWIIIAVWLLFSNHKIPKW